jgi:arylsulfatase A-like enzyme
VPGNVLLITVDQWRGDCLSAAGHPVLDTPALDELCAAGVRFANHWSNAAPCGPARASLLTGTYLHRHRSVQNGTPLDDRFTNLARLARTAGYDPVLFGYTDTTPDPRSLPPDAPPLMSYEGVLPGFSPVLLDFWEEGSPAWGRWLAARGVDVPADPHDLYLPDVGYPGADDHGSTWAPARFAPEHSQTVFVLEAVTEWLERQDGPYFAHVALIRPHPPRRNPVGYHDRYSADEVGPFVGAPDRRAEAALHPLNALVLGVEGVAAPDDETERRQLRATYYGAQAEVDDQLGIFFARLTAMGRLDDTLVVVTSDHGEMGGDHWLLEKLGYWDESFHVPLIVRDPRPGADATRGTAVTEPTEAVDVLPTVCDWLGLETPLQADGWSLLPFVQGEAPAHWRSEAHFEWDFSNYPGGGLEALYNIPMSHCSLAVGRGATEKYVQFATGREVFPPLLFDLDADPEQQHDLAGEPASADRAWRAAERLLQWRMRTDERELTGHIVDPARGGLVVQRDTWR